MEDIIIEFVKKHGNGTAVALDVDQVLAQSLLPVINQLNSETGSHFKLADVKEYPSPGKKFMNVTDGDYVRIYDEVWNKRWDQIGRLGDKKVLTWLFSKFNVDIVSSRGEEAAEPLRKWLKQYYPEFSNKVVVVKKFSDKSSLPYQIYIDDAPRLASALESKQDKLLLLVDAPYNRDIPDSGNVVRVADVNDACIRLIEALPHSK